MARILPKATLIGALVALAGVSADAFGVKYHTEIMQTALFNVAPRLVAELKRIGSKATIQGFLPRAEQELVFANIARDQGDCGSPNDPRVPANPCIAVNTLVNLAVDPSSLAALRFLELEAASDHIDNETIPVASNAIFDARAAIRGYLAAGDFAAARKVLGGTLHTLQDFYAHSNFVETGGANRGEWERRLGKERDAFRPVPGGSQRLAQANERTCENGDYNSSGFLTTGYFFLPLNQDVTSLDGFLVAAVRNFADWDIDAIKNPGKCRHGLQKENVGSPDCTIYQSGINKDAPCRAGFVEARGAALRHTEDFIIELIRDLRQSLGETNPKYAAAIAGFMGYEALSRLGNVRVLRYPGAPPK